MYNTIDKSTLKPGDIVGIKIPTKIGWGYFRYAETIPMTIERITPARTKFIMKNGCEFSKHEPFYIITDKDILETNVAKCAKKISKCLSTLETMRKNGEIYSQSDESIVNTAALLEKLCEDLSK